MWDIFCASIFLAAAFTVVELRANTNFASYVIAHSAEKVPVCPVVHVIAEHYNRQI